MRKVMMVAVLGALTVSLLGHAHASPFRYCENGTIDEKGDRHYAAEVSDTGIELRPYEGGISIPRQALSRIPVPGVGAPQVWFVVNLPTILHSEGTERAINLSGTFIQTENQENLIVLISTVDGNGFRSTSVESLKCRSAR